MNIILPGADFSANYDIQLDLTPLTDYEEDFLAHYYVDGTASQLVNRVNPGTNNLVITGSPTTSAAGMGTIGAGTNGANTSLTLAGGGTMFAIMKRPAGSGYHMICGNNNGNGGAPNGVGFLVGAGLLEFRPREGNSYGAGGVSADQWFFAAFAVGGGVRRMYLPHNEYFDENASTGGFTTGAQTIRIGAAEFTAGGLSNGASVLRLGLTSAVLTNSQLVALYNREKARCSSLGISVL